MDNDEKTQKPNEPSISEDASSSEDALQEIRRNIEILKESGEFKEPLSGFRFCEKYKNMFGLSLQMAINKIGTHGSIFSFLQQFSDVLCFKLLNINKEKRTLHDFLVSNRKKGKFIKVF